MNCITFITIITGVLVFAASQYVLKLILAPIVELRRTMARISAALLYHQAKITNATLDDNIGLELRELSAELLSNRSVLPFYSFFHVLCIFKIPHKMKVLNACQELNAMAYAMIEPPESDKKKMEISTGNVNRLKKVRQLLNIPTSYEDKM